MPWSLDAGSDRTRLTLTGHADIFEAAAFHKVLLQVADSGAPTEVDLAPCTDLDGAALQLLLALRRALEARGGGISFVRAGGRVGQLLARFGLAAGAARSER